MLLSVSDCIVPLFFLFIHLLSFLCFLSLFLFCFPFVSLQTLPLCLHSICCSYLFPNSHSLTSINSHSTHRIPSIFPFITISFPLTALSLSPFSLCHSLSFYCHPHSMTLSSLGQGEVKKSSHSQYLHAHFLSITLKSIHYQYTKQTQWIPIDFCFGLHVLQLVNQYAMFLQQTMVEMLQYCSLLNYVHYILYIAIARYLQYFM